MPSDSTSRELCVSKRPAAREASFPSFVVAESSAALGAASLPHYEGRTPLFAHYEHTPYSS